MAKTLRKGIPPILKYSPLAYFIADESSVTAYEDAFDLCWAPETLAAFRVWLRKRYPTLDALNAQLKAKGLWFPVDISTGSRATIGGMAGRLIVSVLADRYDWRVAIAALGAQGLVGALYFLFALPRALQLWGRAKRRRAPRRPTDFIILDGATANYNLLFGLLCTAALWLQFVLKLK